MVAVVVVGSGNPLKVAAVRQALGAPHTEVVGVEVSSGVAAQPCGVEEGMRGAVHRAQQAFRAAPVVEEGPGQVVAVGMENFVVQVLEEVWM